MAPWPEEVSTGLRLRSGEEWAIVFKKQKSLYLEVACRKESAQQGAESRTTTDSNAHSNGRTVVSSSVTKASNRHEKGKGPIRRQARHHIGHNHHPQQKSDVQPVLALRCRMPM